MLADLWSMEKSHDWPGLSGICYQAWVWCI